MELIFVNLFNNIMYACSILKTVIYRQFVVMQTWLDQDPGTSN